MPCKWFLVVLASESHSMNLLLILWHILATNSRNKGLVWFLNIIWMCLVQFIFNITLLWIEDNFGKSVGVFCSVHFFGLYLEPPRLKCCCSPCFRTLPRNVSMLCCSWNLTEDTCWLFTECLIHLSVLIAHFKGQKFSDWWHKFFFILTYLLCYKMSFMPTNIIHRCFQGFTKLTEHLYMERVIWEETQVWSARALSGTASCRDD